MKNSHHQVRTLHAPSHAVTLTPTAIAYLLRGRPARTLRIRVPVGAGLQVSHG